VLIRIVVLVIGLAATAAMAEEANPCPNPMSGTVRSGYYDFQFQSWSRASGSGYLFGDCVRNNSTLPLFISWAGLSGFVKQNGGVGYVTIPASTDKQLKLQLPLWYGAGPHKLTVETLFPDTLALLNQPTIPDLAIRRVADPIPASRGRTKPGSPLVSEAEIYVPLSAFERGTTQAEVIRAVEKSPQILRKFTMRFISGPGLSAAGMVTKVVDRCEYQLDSPLDVTNNVAIRFIDDELQRDMFKSLEPHDLASDPGRRPGNWTASIESIRAEPRIAPRQLVERQTRMELVTTSGELVLGSMPVVFYRGERATR
jgi:hypothetical protein